MMTMMMMPILVNILIMMLMMNMVNVMNMMNMIITMLMVNKVNRMILTDKMISYLGAAAANQSRALDLQLFPAQREGSHHHHHGDHDDLITIMISISTIPSQVRKFSSSS